MIPIFQAPNFDSSHPSYFGLECPKRKSLYKLMDDKKGCACEGFEIIPHVHGTHIESAAHVFNAKSAMPASLCLPVVTLIIDKFEIVHQADEVVQFLILKNATKGMGFNSSLIPKILNLFPNLVLIGTEEPSFDPIEDGGALNFHRTYFTARPENFLVELLNLSDQRLECNVKYKCLLNPYFIASTDAIPCSPILLPGQGLLSSIFAKNEMALSDSCLFCKIIRGAIPSFRIYETAHTFAFLDINPLSEGHILVIPKFHGARLHEIDDAYLADLLPAAKKILVEGFGEKGAKLIPDFNILQNNGRLAHQEVDHVHFHIIPKRDENEGLGIKWVAQKGNMEQLGKLAESIKSKLA